MPDFTSEAFAAMMLSLCSGLVKVVAPVLCVADMRETTTGAPDAASPHLCLETHSLWVWLPVRCFFGELCGEFPLYPQMGHFYTHPAVYRAPAGGDSPITWRISEGPMAVGQILRPSQHRGRHGLMLRIRALP